MIGRLNHVAIVVPDLDAAAARYRDDLGARVEAPFDLPEHGVRVVMVRLDNTTVELLHPLSDASPVAGFLKKNPGGGMHHVCYEVKDVVAATKAMMDRGVKVLNEKPKIGAHGNPVVFLHPKDFNGVLTELEQVPSK
ncbi:MAG: methylmalonyl-CoA epimerase [Magnetococcales bacterium]|nr:methylmalonyl-CoA epimerase [Magnetococcales bacterium]MBF0149772.1 methylmalonyl-CoA epimerase [Magnetococcales bacterium]MBF0630181.1 methylmalonyl-CoA epimerase [Magnetococcales bacterium]